MRRLLDAAHKKATEIIETNRDKITLMTDMLMEFEILDRQDVLDIMDGKWDTEKKREHVKRRRRQGPQAASTTSQSHLRDPSEWRIDLGDPSPQGT
ncbi:MAG: ATP-dependent zinc metalloprotease FtsH [Chlamydiae bacterium]|nr:ATP-dependent zinc metalloprotease FtsH [Chlamydiota bacterium]